MSRGTVRLALLAAAAAACGEGGGPVEGDAAPAATAAAAPADARGTPAPSRPAPAPGATEPRFRFVDVAREAGLREPVWCGRPEKPHLLDSGGSGLALLDLDGDGDLDLYVVRGWRLDAGGVKERCRNLLYRNRGDGTFDDVSTAAGVDDDGWGCGVAAGDFDGDGLPDLFVTNFGPDVLYRNRGDGTFERVPDPPGMDGWSAGAAFFDADGDGDLDLFVTGYVEATLDEVLAARPTLAWRGRGVAVGPFGLKGKEDRLFRNDGGGRWTDVTREAGVSDVGLYFGFDVVAADLDDDGLDDLYVANDSNPNYLYRNEGGGRFQERGLWSGAALSASGATQAGMGVAVDDFDGDGRPDIFVTNFADDTCALYRNLGRSLFNEVSAPTGLRAISFAPLKWGVVSGDFDLDGDPDLFIANGHIYPQADDPPESGTRFAQRNLLAENVGGAFRDVTAEAGPGLGIALSSRGVAQGDVDGDGDLDLVVSNVDAPPTLLRNDSPRRGAWLIVDAAGARRVVVEAGGRRWTRVAVAGGGFLSVSDPRFHFGLGGAAAVDRVVVAWRDAPDTVVAGPPANAVLRVARPAR